MRHVYGVFAINQDAQPSLCFNDEGKAELYAESFDADKRADVWRKARTDYTFRVLPCPVM
jgi:hypothetical protein